MIPANKNASRDTANAHPIKIGIIAPRLDISKALTLSETPYAPMAKNTDCPKGKIPVRP